jgi:DNA invertase Pin-like site-specific DNA recombinase
MRRMVLTVLGMVAEMELGFIRDRQRAGIDAAKAKGVYKGRPPTFDHAKIVALRKQGKGNQASSLWPLRQQRRYRIMTGS